MIMWELILGLVMGFLAGVAVALSSWIGYDKNRQRRRLRVLHSPDEFCGSGCKHWDSILRQYHDINDAEKAIEEYCECCPINIANEIISSGRKEQ